MTELQTSTAVMVDVWTTDPDTYTRFVWNQSQTVRVYLVTEHDAPAETMHEIDVWSYSEPPTLETLRQDCADWAYDYHDLGLMVE